MGEYKLALLLHLVGVLLFVSGVVLAGVAFETGRRHQQPSEVALLLGLTRVGVVLVVVGSVLLGIFGLWLVHLGQFGYKTGWVDESIVLYLVALVLGALGGQRPKQARRLATQLHAEQAVATAQLRELLDDRSSLAANYGSLIAILGVLALMVFKP